MKMGQDGDNLGFQKGNQGQNNTGSRFEVLNVIQNPKFEGMVSNNNFNWQANDIQEAAERDMNMGGNKPKQNKQMGCKDTADPKGPSSRVLQYGLAQLGN